MTTDGELWHIVEAKRDDGTPTMFRIRELDPKTDLTRIFVVELPYSTSELSRLPNAAAYRRVADLEEQWLRPACQTLGWELVGSKTEDGSFFLYMYGGGDPDKLVEKLSPFDAGLGFYDDEDPEWKEYGTLRELLDQAKAIATPAVKKKAPVKKPVSAKKKTPTKKQAARRKPPAKKKPATKAAPNKKATKKKRTR
jgi:hypothetical protein